MTQTSHWKGSIRFWEVRRVPYSAVIVGAAVVGWLITSSVQAGLDYPRNGTSFGVFLRFVGLVFGLNACYSLGYALESIVHSVAAEGVRTRMLRHAAFYVGLAISVPVAFRLGALIGFYEFSF